MEANRHLPLHVSIINRVARAVRSLHSDTHCSRTAGRGQLDGIRRNREARAGERCASPIHLHRTRRKEAEAADSYCFAAFWRARSGHGVDERVQGAFVMLQLRRIERASCTTIDTG